jgi:hypothetical protein
VSEVSQPGADPEGGEEQGRSGFRPPIRQLPPDNTSRGLKAVDASRGARNRIPRPPLKVIVWFVMILAVFMTLYFRWESSQVESARQKLLQRQAAANATVGDKWYSVRDRIEGWTMALAGPPQPDLVETAELAGFKFQEMPGLYLRLRLDQARDVASVRSAAMASLKDGFTGCLMRMPDDGASTGKSCNDADECETGQLCNEYRRCAAPAQPYNLRLAYRGFSVLSPEFEKSVREAGNNLTLRALDASFDDASRFAFPIASDMIARSQFFLVVIDERPAPPAPPKDMADAGPPAEDVAVNSGETYPSRIGLWRLSDDKLLLRLTRQVTPELLGAMPISDPEIAAARTRQAQSCALAMEVRQAVGDLK